MEKLKMPLLVVLAVAALVFAGLAISKGMGGGNPDNNEIAKTAEEVGSDRTDTPRVPQELLNKGVGPGTRSNGGQQGIKKGGN